MISVVAGDLVKNIRAQKVGVLIGEQESHKGYWKVFTQGDIEIWYVNNMEEIKNDNTRSVIRRHLV